MSNATAHIHKARSIWKWIFPGISPNGGNDYLTRSEFLDLLKTGFAAVTFASVFIAGLTFYLQGRALTKEYEWRHKKEAQDILKIWDERTGAQKAAIESYYRRRYRSDRMLTITREDAIAVRHALRQVEMFDSDSEAANAEPELWTLRVKITELLNYFETISTACLRDIADEGILRDSLGGPMIDWSRYLHNYIEVANQETGRDVWRPYHELMLRWDSALGQKSSRLIDSSSSSKQKPLSGLRSLERR